MRIQSAWIIIVIAAVGLGVAVSAHHPGLLTGSVAFAETGHEDHDDSAHNDDDSHADHDDDDDDSHEDHEKNDDHDDHEGHKGGEEGVVHLSPNKLRALNLSTATVRHGALSLTLELAAEVRWNATQVAHVVPRVPGVVRRVHKGIGDSVREGEELAFLDSRELATAKAAYLAALARAQLAQINHDREERLWKQEVSAERDYLEAQTALTESQIEQRLTHLHLHALGVSDRDVSALTKAPDSELTLYRMTAPFDGVIVDKHIARGEMLKDDSQAFLIVDHSNVWVIGRAYERDLRLLRKEQKATVRLDAFPGELFEGSVDYIASQLDAETRTVGVRVVLDNPDSRFRSGMFGVMSVFANPSLNDRNHLSGLIVPRAAVQRVKGGFVVFRKTEPGVFRMLPVKVGGQSKEFALVSGDLRAGDLVAIGDTFVLKSESAKEEMGGGHSH